MNENIKNFLNAIVTQVKFKEAHEEIKQEYLSHIQESTRVGISYGLSEEAATGEAIKRMGNPTEIGVLLNQSHSSKIDFVTVFSVLFLCLLGLFSLNSLGFAAAQSIWMFLGIIVGSIMVFLKPSKLVNASPYIFFTTIIALFFAHLSGVSYNGQPYLQLGTLNIKIIDLSVVLFVFSIAGLLARSKTMWMLILSLLPALYYACISSTFPGILYFVSTLSLLTAYKISWERQSMFTVFNLLFFAFTTNKTSFVSPETFLSLQKSETHTDFIFQYVLATTPILAALALLIFGFLFTRLIAIRSEIRNSFTASTSQALLVLFFTSAVWSVISGLGYIPMPQTGVNLPFISYGGSLMVAHLTMIGFILGAIRRKTLHLV